MEYLTDSFRGKDEGTSLVPMRALRSQMAMQADAPLEAQLGLLDYLTVIGKRYHYLLGFIAAGMVLTLVYTFSQRLSYRAYLQLEVQELNQNFMNVEQMNPSASSQAGAGSADNFVQTQAQVLQSDELLERVIRRLHLDEDPAYLAQSGSAAERYAQKVGLEKWLGRLPDPRYAQIIRETLGLRTTDSETPMARALRVAHGSLKVKTSAQSTLVQIYYVAPDRTSGAVFLNTLAEEFIANTMDMRWAGTERTAAWLEKRLSSLRANLETSELKLQNYAKRSGLLYTNDRESVGEEKLREIQSELSKAQADEAVAQAKYERSTAVAAEQLPEVRDDLMSKEYFTRLADLERDRSQDTATMKPEHYKVQKLDAEIAQLKKLIAAQQRTTVERIASDYRAASWRQTLLGEAYDRQFKAVSEQAEQSVPMDLLKREVESNRQFYQDMLQKVNSAGIATAIRASNIRVVNAARPPQTSYGPDLSVNLSMGVGTSFVLGLFACFLTEGLERRNRRMQKPGDAFLSLGTQELGAIPAIHSARTKMWLPEQGPGNPRGRRSNGSTALNLSAPGAPTRDHAGTALVHWQERSSAVTDSFHMILDTLLYSAGEAKTGQTFVITSALPFEGKTTIATHLALAMAAIDKKVLLVDADLRRPRVHTRFGLPNSVGLTNLLESSATPEDAIRPVTVNKKGGLWVLTTGGTKLNPASLLARSNLAEFLDSQRSNFDAILIDSPPALLFPDARLLGRCSDGVVLVVRSNQNPVPVYRETLNLLQQAGSVVLGVVLNNWRPSSAERNYYSSYAKH